MIAEKKIVIVIKTQIHYCQVKSVVVFDDFVLPRKGFIDFPNSIVYMGLNYKTRKNMKWGPWRHRFIYNI